MGLVYEAISTFDVSCCAGLIVQFTENRSWVTPNNTGTSSTTGSTLTLDIAQNLQPDLPNAAGIYTVTHVIDSVINPNGCTLPNELTVGNIITYTYSVTPSDVDDCNTCIVTETSSIESYSGCVPTDTNIPNTFDIQFGKFFNASCCPNLQVEYTIRYGANTGNNTTQTASVDANGNLFIGDLTNGFVLGNNFVFIDIISIMGDANCVLPFSVGNAEYMFSFPVETECPCTYSLSSACTTGGNLGATVNSSSSGVCGGGILSGPGQSATLPSGVSQSVSIFPPGFGVGTYIFTPNGGGTPITLVLDAQDLLACQGSVDTFYACCINDVCQNCPTVNQSCGTMCQSGTTAGIALNRCINNINCNTDPCDGVTISVTASYDCTTGLSVSASGGTAPYTFSDGNGTMFADGVYNIIATDDNGCEGSTLVTVACVCTPVCNAPFCGQADMCDGNCPTTDVNNCTPPDCGSCTDPCGNTVNDPTPACTAGFIGECCCNGTKINKTTSCAVSDYDVNDCSCDSCTPTASVSQEFATVDIDCNASGEITYDARYGIVLTCNDCCDTSTYAGSFTIKEGNTILSQGNNTLQCLGASGIGSVGSGFGLVLNCSQAQAGDEVEVSYSYTASGLDNCGLPNTFSDTFTYTVTQADIDGCCQCVVSTSDSVSISGSICSTLSGNPAIGVVTEFSISDCDSSCCDASLTMVADGASSTTPLCKGGPSSIVKRFTCSGLTVNEVLSIPYSWSISNPNGCTIQGPLSGSGTLQYTVTQSDLDNCCP